MALYQMIHGPVMAHDWSVLQYIKTQSHCYRLTSCSGPAGEKVIC